MGGWSSKYELAEAPAPEAEQIEFHKLLQESQGLTKNLVRDVIDLLSSLDLLRPTSQILKDNLSLTVGKTDHGSKEETLNLEKCKETALQLLLATEEMQLCQKQSTMTALHKLLQFIKKLVQREVECEPGSFGEELLEGYMKGSETTKTIEEKHADTPETQKPEYKKKRKKDKQKDIFHIEKENRELNQKIVDLEKKYASFYSEKKILNEKVQKLESQLNSEKELKKRANDFASICIPKDQLERLSSKALEAEQEINLLNEKIDSLNEENGRLSSQVFSVEQDKANMETDLKLLQEELNEIREHTKTDNANLSKNESEKETKTKALNEECERLKDEKRILETERNEEKQKYKKLESELTHNSEEHEILIEQKEKKINELIRRVTELDKHIKEREEENSKLNKTLQNANDNFCKVFVDLKREKEALLIERDNEKKRNEDIQTEFEENIYAIRKEVQEAESRTTSLNEECERLKDEKRLLETERSEVVQRYKTLASELTEESAEHKVLIEQKDDRINELIGRETELTETIKEREEENAKLNKSLQNANDNFGKVILNLEREKETMIVERDNEKTRNKDIQTELSNEIYAIRKELQDTESRTTSLNEECERLNDEKRILETERNKEVQRNKTLETELSQKSDEHESLIEQKEEKINGLIRRETELNGTIKEREEENRRLNTTLQNANDNFGKVMGKSEREKEAIIVERDGEKKRNEEIQTEFAEKMYALRKELQDTESRTTSLNEECERLKEEKRILEKERDEEAQRNKQLEIELTQKCNENKILIEQGDEKLNELIIRETELNTTIKEKEEENTKLNKTLQNATDNFGHVMGKSEREREAILIERDDQKRRNEELETKFTKEIDSIRKELQDTETRTLALNKECERLEGEKRILEKERDDGAKREKQIETELAQKSDEHKKLLKQTDERIKELGRRETELKETLKEREEENAKLNETLQNANENFEKLTKKFHTEKEMIVAERNKEKSQKEDLETRLANQNDNFKQQLQQKEMKINDLTLILNEMKSKETECQNVLKEKEQKINELVDLNKAVQKQQQKYKEDCENRNMSLENENQRVQRQLDMLRSDLKAKSDYEKKLLEEARVLRLNLQEKKEHFEAMNNQHENKKLQLKNEISAMTEARLKEKNKMEDRERTLVCDLENVRSSNKTLNDQICKQRNALKENENFITGLKKQMTHIEEENMKLRTRVTDIAQDLENCTAENETMKNELEKIKSRKVIQIQMYSQSGVGLLSSVEDELKCVLKSQMDVEESVDVDIIICAKASDIQPNIPLLILCIQASRLGTAVASTVQGLTLTPKMAVLIFHHKDVHALPNQASERVLTGQELRSLGGIFDLAFLSGKGIYPCEMNRANFISLINFIKREGKKRLREDL